MILNTIKRFYRSIIDKVQNHVLWKSLEHEKTIIELTIYDKLKLAIDRIINSELDLNKDPKGLGIVISYSENIVGFTKSLIQINSILKEDGYVVKSNLYLTRTKEIDLDSFMFSNNGVYLNHPDVELNKAIEQLLIYHKLTNGIENETHGVKEHNHRQLYNFTVNTTDLINSLFIHFAK